LDTFNVINSVALGNGISMAYLIAMIGVRGYVGLFMVIGSYMFAGRDL